jgi:hypothetical protein
LEWKGREKKKGKEKAVSGIEFLFLNCRRLLNFFCFSFPSFFLSFVATNKPLPLPHATLVPFLYKFHHHHHHHHHHYRCSAFFFLPRDSCCSCSISVTLVSRTTLEKHTHTHIPTPSPAAAARRLAAVVFVEEGKKKKNNKPPLLLVETNFSFSFWRREQKTASSSSLWKQSGSCPCCCCNLSLFSLCVFHIIAEAFVVVLRSLFLSGEEARVAHVVLYTYGYIDRWIDAREDREIEREREIRGDYRALNTCV